MYVDHKSIFWFLLIPFVVSPAFGQTERSSMPDRWLGSIYYLLLSDESIELPPLVTCDEDESVDESCKEGSQGRRSDNTRLLPLRPSLTRDVHMVEIGAYPRRGANTNVRAHGYFTRPHIPPYRTSTDGRIAMQARTRTENPDGEVYHFYLFEPKRLSESFLSSKSTEDAGMTILSSRTSWKLKRSEFVDTNAEGSSMHSAICNNPEKPVRTCGTNGNNDCYDLTIITPFNNTEEEHIEIWGTDITVEVADPKTINSRIVDIRTEAPKQGAIWPGIERYLETMITSDGRLMAGRVSGARLTFEGANGQQISAGYNSAYSAYSPNFPACDPEHFESPLPISHMPYDNVIKENWEVARYPWRYPDGTVIPDGADLRATYPWLDSEGKNIFFGTSTNFEPLHETGKYEVECLDVIDDSDCDLTGEAERGDDTRSVSVVGLWTQGRTVLLDNLVNNVDWGVGKEPTRQRLAKLYDGEDGWVRVASGRTNNSDGSTLNMEGASGNINFIDSIESKFNHDENLSLKIPADVAWLMSNGTATDVVAFDDWVNPYGLISSSMVQSKTGENSDPDFERVQNSASGLFNTPAHGQVVGAGSVERVALGGVRGKGLFLRPSSALRYSVPNNQPELFDTETWYLGLFIDPRMKNDRFYRRLIEFPNGSAIDIQGLHSLSIVKPDGSREDLRFNTPLPFAEYSHLGFRINSNGNAVEVFRDGMAVFLWRNPIADGSLKVSRGDLFFGRGRSITDPRRGFHGWIDEVKLVARADRLNSEEICNKAMGSIVGLAPTSLFANTARTYPASTHQTIKAESKSANNLFRCHTDFSNNDGWVDLNNLPEQMTLLRDQILFPEGPLVFNQARPDSTENGFCLSCHADDNTSLRPTSLLPSSLMFSGVLMQNDTRRQPLQPPARIHGNIPARTWGDLPSRNLRTNNRGRSIDEFISQ